jgi:large subunit ribosomal protein L19
MLMQTKHLSGWSSFVYSLRTSENKKEEILMDALKIIEESSMKKELPSFSIGDTVKVGVRIREGKTERIQVFEGTVIAIKGSGISKTFTVRRVSYGVGVERVFPLHSANVDSVTVIRKGKVRRAKLYYLRDRVGKAAKVKEDI